MCFMSFEESEDGVKEKNVIDVNDDDQPYDNGAKGGGGKIEAKFLLIPKVKLKLNLSFFLVRNEALIVIKLNIA